MLTFSHTSLLKPKYKGLDKDKTKTIWRELHIFPHKIKGQRSRKGRKKKKE